MLWIKRTEAPKKQKSLFRDLKVRSHSVNRQADERDAASLVDFDLRRTLRSGIHFSAKVGQNWKWSNGVRKGEIDLIWCISITNNVKSYKQIDAIMAKSETNEPTCCATTEPGILLFRFDPSIDPSCHAWVSAGTKSGMMPQQRISVTKEQVSELFAAELQQRISLGQSRVLTWADQLTNLCAILYAWTSLSTSQRLVSIETFI